MYQILVWLKMYFECNVYVVCTSICIFVNDCILTCSCAVSRARAYTPTTFDSCYQAFISTLSDIYSISTSFIHFSVDVLRRAVRNTIVNVNYTTPFSIHRKNRQSSFRTWSTTTLSTRNRATTRSSRPTLTPSSASLIMATSMEAVLMTLMQITWKMPWKTTLKLV